MLGQKGVSYYLKNIIYNYKMKSILITGTSKGIGYNLCKHYINKNYKVISISRSNIDFSNKNLLHIQQDVTHINCHENILKLIKDEKIDNCIINAGINNDAMFHKMKYNQWFDTINTNLISIYNILNPVIENMRKYENGNIIFVSSVIGKKGLIGGSNYACSKSAIYGLTKSLSLENASKNILVNSISPGYINDGMGNNILDKYKLELCKTIPLKKFGETQDILDIMDYLIEKNKYITGSNIDINGGLY
jgi:NAD(P)-dependent dehydrogenase (short-subunit alcohol dehydrogenase family)